MNKLLSVFLLFNSIFFFGQVKKVYNWEEAQKIAQAENKNILIEFTGSNWCKPCIKMEKEVLKSNEFEEFAKEKLVIFVLDLQMPIKVDSENFKIFEKYKKQYNVNHYPTYILSDFTGKEQVRIKGYYSINNFIKKLSK